MLNFDILEKGLGLVTPAHFVCDFSRKIFPMLYSINRPCFIVYLLLLLEIFGNMCIVIICFPAEDAINFEINLSFSYQVVFLHDRKGQDKNINMLRTKRGLEVN